MSEGARLSRDNLFTRQSCGRIRLPQFLLGGFRDKLGVKALERRRPPGERAEMRRRALQLNRARQIRIFGTRSKVSTKRLQRIGDRRRMAAHASAF